MAMHEADDIDGMCNSMHRQSEERWHLALTAARILATGGPAVGGLWLTARASGVRDRFLAHLRSLTLSGPSVRLPPGVTAATLGGHLDIARSLAEGRMAWDSGILATADGGMLVIPMAERLEPGAAAVIAEAMDTQVCPSLRPGPDRTVTRVPCRFTVVALDEAADQEEALPTALADRLGLHINLDGVALGSSVVPPVPPQTHDDWQSVEIADGVLEPLCAIATAAGHRSLRTLHHLSRVARIHAAISGRDAVGAEDAVAALRLCIGVEPPQAQPKPDQQAAPPPPPAENRAPSPPGPQEGEDGAEQALYSLTELLAAVEQGRIDGLSLASVERAARHGRKSGKGGAAARNARRGRPFATSSSPPFPDARPDLLETLRAAIPWQRFRARLRGGSGDAARLRIHKEDFRYRRRRHEQPSTAIFIVDASGSTALERLGETKGAIEQLLADCYVRRDEVSLIAFRGKAAEILMPPTRSLVSAKRRLSAMPGGGPTPLASGLERGLEMALSARRRGSTPIVVVMTDGSGNIALDGTADRALAGRQTERIARLYREHGLTCICIDIARRPRDSVTSLAGMLGAELHLLRQADAARMSQIVRTTMHRAPP